MSCYRLTSGAESDTEQILRYTLRKWGAKQAARYAAQLETCLDQIATCQVQGRTFSERHPDVRSYRCGHHYIFFIWQGEIILVLAVLHESMDLIRHLGNRIGDS